MGDYDVGKAFRRIEDELIYSMIRNLDRHKAEEAVEGFRWSMWQAEQLKSLERYRQKNSKKYGAEFVDLNRKIKELIRTAHQNGGMKQEKRILQAISRGYKGIGGNKSPSHQAMSQDFFRLNERKLEALIESTTHDMEKAETAVLRMANDQYRKIIFNAQVYANTGAGTYKKAVDMATKDFLAAGLNCIEYKNGARHSLSDYADMAIRTASKRAYLQGEGEKRQEWGISTVIVNKRGNPCPKCLPFVGKVLIDDVWSGGPSDGVDPETGKRYPLMSTAIAAGLYHPRCKDSHTTYFPGISTADDTWTKEELEAVENVNHKETQRQYAGRQADKYERLSKYSLDEENKNKYTLKADDWKKVEKLCGTDIIKETKVPDSILRIPGVNKNVVDEIQKGIDVAEKEFNIDLKEIIVENMGERLPDTPYLCRYINENGLHKAVFVINSGFDFSDMEYVVEEGYRQNYFAGKTLSDHILHEMAHVMTSQQCRTAEEFDLLYESVSKAFVPGVSGYSDYAQDGFETIAEAFVKMHNGENVPDEARKLVEKYILRWKK